MKKEQCWPCNNTLLLRAHKGLSVEIAHGVLGVLFENRNQRYRGRKTNFYTRITHPASLELDEAESLKNGRIVRPSWREKNKEMAGLWMFITDPS